MDMSQSKNLRIRGNYDFITNLEENVKKLETQFGIDFKSLSQWKEVIQRMYAVQTECKKKLLLAKKRKVQIIERLYLQKYRISPFELTDNFARTNNLWKNVKYNMKQDNISLKSEQSSMTLHNVSINNAIASEESDIETNGHPNSEVIQSKDHISKPEVEIDSKLNSPYYLPNFICTDQHKILSSLGSNDIVFKLNSSKNIDNDLKSETIREFLPNETKLVQSYPEKLMIISDSNKEQLLKFSLLNRGTKYVHIQFKSLSDGCYFKTFRIFPLVSLKLNPGLSKVYKLNFTLHKNIEVNDISLILYFRIENATTEEILCVPVKGNLKKNSSVIVSETVNIPPVYLWQVNAKCGYPKGVVQIKVCGKIPYNLHIRKKELNFFKICEDTHSLESLKVATPNTESLMHKLDDNEIETLNNTSLFPRIKEMNPPDKIKTEIETLKSFDIVTPVLYDILNLVYEPFVFKNTFLRLIPKSKRIVIVYFTKAVHIGYHQSYYDFIFFDNDELFFTKTIKVFAEVLPHPILINPNILDTTKSPVVFGHSEDHFTIINTHKVYPVTIAIKTTKEMDKIFQILPRMTSIPGKSKVNFIIRFCRKQVCSASEHLNILAYFTVKIIVNGHKSIYQNVPPFYYEVIAPCAREIIENFQKECIDEETRSSPVEIAPKD